MKHETLAFPAYMGTDRFHRVICERCAKRASFVGYVKTDGAIEGTIACEACGRLVFCDGGPKCPNFTLADLDALEASEGGAR